MALSPQSRQRQTIWQVVVLPLLATIVVIGILFMVHASVQKVDRAATSLDSLHSSKKTSQVITTDTAKYSAYLPLVATPQTAFPGAEGYGALSRGGRGGRVIEVTTLADNPDNPPTGSLRACLEAHGPRVCVFRVAGIIGLKSDIRIQSPYVTIAGQTAPGSGIVISGDSNASLITVSTHDVIIRYLRFRNIRIGDPGTGQVNLTIREAHETDTYNVIVDHISASWTLDENVHIYNYGRGTKLRDITVQRSIMSEGLQNHSTGTMISGRSSERAWLDVFNVSYHHNLLAHNHSRNPAATTRGVRVVNNVVYNWGPRGAQSDRNAVVDWVGNYFKAGVDSHPDRAVLHRLYDPDTGALWPQEPSIYLSGNVVAPGFTNPTYAEQWDIIRERRTNDPLPERLRRHTQLVETGVAITQHSAYEAYASVMGDVGANARLDCLGNWIPNQDAIDMRILSDVNNGTGRIISDPAETGGIPPIDPGTPCVDSDRDGMPDVWEEVHGLNPNAAGDGARDADGDRYTNLEEYLNGTNPTN